ncbi:hypothetical protein CHS0354_004818, partial [Potamilus streckersoni]
RMVYGLSGRPGLHVVSPVKMGHNRELDCVIMTRQRRLENPVMVMPKSRYLVIQNAVQLTENGLIGAHIPRVLCHVVMVLIQETGAVYLMIQRPLTERHVSVLTPPRLVAMPDCAL